MCKSSNTTTTIQQPKIPEWLEDAFKGVVQKAGEVAQTPFNPATMRNVAGFSGDQEQAFQMANQMVGNWQPYLDTAAGFAQQLGSPISGDQITNYMNPFQQQVIDATMANIAQNQALQQQQIAGNAALQGALGGDRVKVAQAELARQQGLAANQTLANLNAQNFNQALAAAQADRTAAGNAATQFGSLANQISALGAGDYSRLLAQGGLQQGLAQQMLDTASANAALQAQYPFAVTGWEQGIYTGASPSFTGYATTQSQPAPNPLNTILGLGAMGLGAFLSDERLKEDIEPVGELYDGTTVYKYRMVGDPRTQIGVLAQEVETRTPEAVHEVGGVKLVNYDEATRPSEGLAARRGFAEGGWVFPGNVVLGGRGRSSQDRGMPYPRVNSYVPSTQSQLIGSVQQPPLAKPPPPPRQRDEDQDDPIKMFNEARKAAQGLNAGLGQIIGKLDSSQGPGGWTTSVQPTMAGLGNYLGNFLGMATGGRVGYADGGGALSRKRIRKVKNDSGNEFVPAPNSLSHLQNLFGGMLPGWVAQGQQVPPGVTVSPVASGVSQQQMAGFLPQGAQFTPLAGNFGALVDTDSLLAGMAQPPQQAKFGGRIGYQQGGPVDPNQQMPAQMPTGASQAGLGAPPGMMPQGMPMAAPAAPVGLGMPMGGMMPPGMPGPMPMGGPAGAMPALPPPGGLQAPMPQPGQPQGGLGQPIRIPPRKAPYGRKVLEKQLEMEAEGLAKRREGFQSGGVVDGVYDPVNDVWTVPQNTPETQSSGIGDTLSSMWDRARAGKYSWLSEPLIAAGAAMMASRSPHVGPAIGEGALMGVRTHQERRKAEELERRAREQLELQRAQFAETQKMNALRAAEAELRLEEMRDPNLPYERRAQVLERFGLDPNSKEGQAFILTGKLPDSLTGEAKAGLNPIYAKDAQGNTVLLQPTTTGEAVLTRLPEGVTISTGVDRIDLGTHWGLVDKKSGDIVGTLPKELEEAERQKGRGTEIGKAEGRMLSPEARVKKVEAESHLANAVHNLERLAAQAKEIRDNPSLWRATGFMSVLPSVPGGEASNIDAAMVTLKSQTGFGVLQAMRDASKTGGALGQVSNIENELLQNNLAALEQSQSTEEFKRNLDKIIEYTEAAKARLTGAYRETYGEEFDPSKYAPGKFQGRLQGGPAPGTVEDGYRFLGGDPSDSANWEKVN